MTNITHSRCVHLRQPALLLVVVVAALALIYSTPSTSAPPATTTSRRTSSSDVPIKASSPPSRWSELLRKTGILRDTTTGNDPPNKQNDEGPRGGSERGEGGRSQSEARNAKAAVEQGEGAPPLSTCLSNIRKGSSPFSTSTKFSSTGGSGTMMTIDRWSPGGVLGHPEAAAQAALNRILLAALAGTPTTPTTSPKGSATRSMSIAAGDLDSLLAPLHPSPTSSSSSSSSTSGAYAVAGRRREAVGRLYSTLLDRLTGGAAGSSSASSSTGTRLPDPFIVDDCAVVMTPAATAQCLVAAVLSVDGGDGPEAAALRAAVLHLRSANNSDNSSSSSISSSSNSSSPPSQPPPVLFDFFRDVAAFRPTQCAQLATCLLWSSGRLVAASGGGNYESGPPSSSSDLYAEGHRRAVAAVAEASRRTRRHFGARGRQPHEVSRLLALRRALIVEAGSKEAVPLAPFHPLEHQHRLERIRNATGTMGGEQQQSNSKKEKQEGGVQADDAGAAIVYDEDREGLAVVSLRSSPADAFAATTATASSANANAVVVSVAPVPSLTPRTALAVLQAAGLRSSHVLQPSNGVFPGIVALSGDSVLRAVFYTLVAKLRQPRLTSEDLLRPAAAADNDDLHAKRSSSSSTGGEDREDDSSRQHAWSAGPALVSGLLYVRFGGCCDVLLHRTNVAGNWPPQPQPRTSPLAPNATTAPADKGAASTPQLMPFDRRLLRAKHALLRDIRRRANNNVEKQQPMNTWQPPPPPPQTKANSKPDDEQHRRDVLLASVIQTLRGPLPPAPPQPQPIQKQEEHDKDELEEKQAEEMNEEENEGTVDDTDVPVGWVVDVLRSVCAVDARLCPDTLVAFHFDGAATAGPAGSDHRQATAWMAPEARDLFLRLERGGPSTLARSTNSAATAEPPYFGAPLAAHVHSVGFWPQADPSVMNRVFSRLVTTDEDDDENDGTNGQEQQGLGAANATNATAAQDGSSTGSDRSEVGGVAPPGPAKLATGSPSHGCPSPILIQRLSPSAKQQRARDVGPFRDVMRHLLDHQRDALPQQAPRAGDTQAAAAPGLGPQALPPVLQRAAIAAVSLRLSTAKAGDTPSKTRVSSPSRRLLLWHQALLSPSPNTCHAPHTPKASPSPLQPQPPSQFPAWWEDLTQTVAVAATATVVSSKGTTSNTTRHRSNSVATSVRVPLFVARVTGDERPLWPSVQTQPSAPEYAVMTATRALYARLARTLLGHKHGGKHKASSSAASASLWEKDTATMVQDRERAAVRTPRRAARMLQRMEREAWLQLRLLLDLAARGATNPQRPAEGGLDSGGGGQAPPNTNPPRLPPADVLPSSARDAYRITSAAARKGDQDPWIQQQRLHPQQEEAHSSHRAASAEAAIHGWYRTLQTHLHGHLLPAIAEKAQSKKSRKNGGGHSASSSGTSKRAPPSRLPAEVRLHLRPNAYIYDGALLQTLHPFIGNDMLHADCHAAVPSVGAGFGEWLPPNLVPQLEHAHAGLFTSLQKNTASVSQSGADNPPQLHAPLRRRASGGGGSPPENNITTTDRVNPTCPVEGGPGEEVPGLDGVTLHDPASSSTALSLYFQLEQRRTWMSSLPGCVDWRAATSMYLRGGGIMQPPQRDPGPKQEQKKEEMKKAKSETKTAGSPQQPVPRRQQQQQQRQPLRRPAQCGVVQSQSYRGCRSPLAEAELLLLLGHIAEVLDAER